MEVRVISQHAHYFYELIYLEREKEHSIHPAIWLQRLC